MKEVLVDSTGTHTAGGPARDEKLRNPGPKVMATS